jgi:hypothetical protein
MGLDYILRHPDRCFLDDEAGRLEYFENLGLSRDLFPQSQGRFFPDKFPISVDLIQRTVSFCYLDGGAFSSLTFKKWLDDYMPLMTALDYSAKVVYVSDSDEHFSRAEARFERHARRGLPTRLLEYFQDRLAIERGDNNTIAAWSRAKVDIYRDAKKRYSGQQYEEQYKAWKKETNAVRRGDVTFTTCVVPYSYNWLDQTWRNS